MIFHYFHYFFFFFLMIRRPPRSTLFPYTDALPIFPRQHGAGGNRLRGSGIRGSPGDGAGTQRAGSDHELRSEEHTSELQSQSNLVCRLLLEKKKSTREPHYVATLVITPPQLISLQS